MGLHHLAASAVLVLLQLSAAAAQEFPSRYITEIVPFGPGNSVDIVGRLLAGRMSELLGQQVIVENIAGAGGSTGTARAARAAPDGYTIVIGGADTMAQNQTLFEKPAYNPTTDFVPIALAVDLPLLLVGRNSLPPNDLKELIPYLKSNQDKMQFGSSGVGGATHLACAQVMKAVGVTLAHVPYRSAGAGIQDLISGNLDLYCPVASGALPQVRAKTIKFFGVLTDQRSPLLPDLPTAAEQGLPGHQRQLLARTVCAGRNAGADHGEAQPRGDGGPGNARCRVSAARGRRRRRRSRAPHAGLSEEIRFGRDRQLGEDHQRQRRRTENVERPSGRKRSHCYCAAAAVHCGGIDIDTGSRVSENVLQPLRLVMRPPKAVPLASTVPIRSTML